MPSISTDLFLLCKDLLEAFLFDSDIDCVLPVPMHSLKKWKRGYNQAEALSSQIAKRFNLPHRPKMLKKTALFFIDDSLEYIDQIDRSLKGTDNPIQDVNILKKRKKS